jgi:hypothetical protein
MSPITIPVTMHGKTTEYEVTLTRYKDPVLTVTDKLLVDAGCPPTYPEKLYGLALTLKPVIDAAGMEEELMESADDEWVVTVNLGEFISLKNCAYIDSKNTPQEFIDALKQAEIIQSIGDESERYQLYSFTDTFIQQQDNNPEYQEYSEAFNEYLRRYCAAYDEREDYI